MGFHKCILIASLTCELLLRLFYDVVQTATVEADVHLVGHSDLDAMGGGASSPVRTFCNASACKCLLLLSLTHREVGFRRLVSTRPITSNSQCQERRGQ